MPRIPLIPIESMEGQLKEAASMLKESLGVVPHSFRTYAHRPEIALAFANLGHAVFRNWHGRSQTQNYGRLQSLDNQWLSVLHWPHQRHAARGWL